MSRRLLTPILFLLGALWACSPDPSPPDTGGGTPPSEGERVTGSERIGWAQQAPSRDEVNSYEYVAYVDNHRMSLGKARCDHTTADQYGCSAPLPALSPGRRTLELATVSGGKESPRSQAIVLLVGPALQAPLPDGEGLPLAEGASSPTAKRNACPGLQLVASGLTAARSFAAVPDGRLLYVSGDRDVGVIAATGGKVARLAVDSPCRNNVPAAPISIAADPDFARTRLIFVAWQCGESERPLLLAVRYREVAGVLGEAAVILERPVKFGTRTLMTIDADRRLVLALAGRHESTLLRVSLDGQPDLSLSDGTPPMARPPLRALAACTSAPVTLLANESTVLALRGTNPTRLEELWTAAGPVLSIACADANRFWAAIDDQLVGPGGLRFDFTGMGQPQEILLTPEADVFVLVRQGSAEHHEQSVYRLDHEVMLRIPARLECGE